MSQPPQVARLPLHHALMRGAPASDVLGLLKKDSSLAEIRDSDGKLALHHALERRAPAEVVLAILKANPGACGASRSGSRGNQARLCRSPKAACCIVGGGRKS